MTSMTQMHVAAFEYAQNNETQINMSYRLKIMLKISLSSTIQYGKLFLGLLIPDKHIHQLPTSMNPEYLKIEIKNTAKIYAQWCEIIDSKQLLS